MRGTTKLWRRFSQTALAALAMGCAAAPLRRHATAVPDGSGHAELVVLLDTLDDLRARNLLSLVEWDRLCALVPPPTRSSDGDVLFSLAADVAPECASARTALAAAVQARDALESAGRVRAMDAIDAALQQIHPVDDACPTRGDDALAIVAAAVRHLDALGHPGGYVGLEGAREACRIATVGEPVHIGPPREHGCEARVRGVMRGDLLPDVPRIAPPDATPPPPGTDSFEDDLYFAPDEGPFATSPTVEVSVCIRDSLWLGQIDGRWMVHHQIHVEP